MNNLITTSLVKTKQIKDTFSIYYVQSINSIQIKGGFDLKSKYAHALGIQYTKIQELPFQEFYRVPGTKAISRYVAFIEQITDIHTSFKIPRKYLPVKVIVEKPFKFRWMNESMKSNLIRLDFKSQIISYLEQKPTTEIVIGFAIPMVKEFHQNVIQFFKSLNEHDEGIDFDKYISDWSEEIINELKEESKL